MITWKSIDVLPATEPTRGVRLAAGDAVPWIAIFWVDAAHAGALSVSPATIATTAEAGLMTANFTIAPP
jgi:hypothetical protein